MNTITNSVTAQWLYQPGSELQLSWKGQTLYHFHFATDHLKPYFHPLHTTDGVLLTAFEPWDHVWHRGLWFSWKYLNSVNYWEESEDDSHDGKTHFVGPEQVVFNEGGATVALHYQYAPKGQPAVLREERRVMLHLPESDGTYRIDWEGTWTPTQGDVVFDRTPINEETPWGGYAGLSWRAARTMGAFRSLNSEGQTNDTTEHPHARWTSFWGRNDGGREVLAGMTLFDHPTNLRYPSRWRSFMDPEFGYLNAAFLLAEPYTLPQGQQLKLRYRVLIHDGAAQVDMLEDEFSRFAES